MKFQIKDHLIELFLAETLLFLAILYIDDYIGLMLCLFISAISAFVLLIALIAELIEKSKVPRWYFFIIFLTAVAPAISLIAYTVITKGNFNWMDGII